MAKPRFKDTKSFAQGPAVNRCRVEILVCVFVSFYCIISQVKIKYIVL
jgi:hypothetical protein